MHRICKKVSDWSWNGVIEVLKFKVVGDISSIDNVKTLIVEQFNCFWELLRLEVRKDLCGIPSPQKMGCFYDLLLENVIAIGSYSQAQGWQWCLVPQLQVFYSYPTDLMGSELLLSRNSPLVVCQCKDLLFSCADLKFAVLLDTLALL